MLYCSFEPGLLILQGLEPHEIKKAYAVVRSLITHKKKMDQVQVQIPMTQRYFDRISNALDNIPIKNPPLEKDLRRYVYAMLAKASSPPLPPMGCVGTICKPDFISEWIDEETKRIWLDSLTAAIFDEFTDKEIKLSTATWYRQNIPPLILVSNSNLCAQLGIINQDWEFPVIADDLDWDRLFCLIHGWPDGLDSTLIDCYAKRILGISKEQLGFRRKIVFESSCYRDVSRETDFKIREAIIEVIACRVYNRVMPEHRDETISSQSGTRRVTIKKMTPPVRFHYLMDDESITYTMYSTGKHNRGL